jgi:CBS domain-containing protein
VREHGEYGGVLDLRDMVKFAVQHYKESLPAEDQEEQSKEEKEAMSFLTTAPVISTNTLKYLSRMVPFRVVKQSALVTDVVKVFSSGAHIVGITKDSGKCEVVSICTQGQLFQSLCKLWKNMLQGGDSPVQECKLMALKTAKYIKTPVKTISSDVKAIEAFEKMSQYNLSGLAVVDKEGRLIGNTSATDIKLWLVKSISLEFKIEKFLQLVLQGHVNEKAPVVCSTLKTSVGLALDKFRATRYHRLWIVDDKSVPLGVLAITDVYKFLSDVPK